jgi:Tfp pilus assembly protein PilO
MRKTITALIVFLIVAGGFYYFQEYEYKPKPAKIRELDISIQKENEKLIAAQIIAGELKQVTHLIEGNLAQSARDSLAEDASLPFMDQLTDALRKHDIDLVRIEPGNRRNFADHLRVPYYMEIVTSYASLVGFLNDMEKSNRLVTLQDFELNSTVKQFQALAKEGKIDKRPVNLTLSTLTLIKQR